MFYDPSIIDSLRGSSIELVEPAPPIDSMESLRQRLSDPAFRREFTDSVDALLTDYFNAARPPGPTAPVRLPLRRIDIGQPPKMIADFIRDYSHLPSLYSLGFTVVILGGVRTRRPISGSFRHPIELHTSLVQPGPEGPLAVDTALGFETKSAVPSFFNYRTGELHYSKKPTDPVENCLGLIYLLSKAKNLISGQPGQ